MNNFNNKGFNKGGFGGKPSFGGGGRGDFKKKSWDSAPRGGRDFGGDKQMFPATCSSCGKSCQVPFRPSGGKEVFCNDCFGKVKGDETFVRNDARPSSGGQNIDAVVRQLQVVASKLDQLIGIMNAQAKPAKVTTGATLSEVVAEAITEKPAKAKKVAAPKKAAAKKKTA